MSAGEQESLVIDVWTIGVERRQELIDVLRGLFERFRSSDGFIEARILQGSQGTDVLTYLRMRSAADRQRVEGDPEVQAGLQALGKIGRPHRDVFDLVWVYTPPAEGAPVSPSRGAY